MQTLGEQIAAARKARGLTQDAVAKVMFVTRQTVSSWENDRTLPDLETLRRLSQVLECDLLRDQAPPAEVNQPQPPAPALRRRWMWIAAGAAVILCVALSVGLWRGHRDSPVHRGEAFDPAIYLVAAENHPGQACLTFDNRAWEASGDQQTFTRYDFRLREVNGVGFDIEAVELKLESAKGGVYTQTLTPADLDAADLGHHIEPGGTYAIDGGFPAGEFVRAGIAVQGAEQTFYSLIEF